MTTIDINFLDHVAIRVKDINESVNWYEKVLGLKRYQLPEWGDFPVFMLANKSGIALFPAKPDDPKIAMTSKNVKIDHFAFNVNRENFAKARIKYDQLGLEYEFQDHHYFHSLYTRDLDDHVVELTTLVVDDLSFYGGTPKVI